MNDATTHAAPAILEADTVFKTYRLGRVDVPVLRGASLAVREGEFVAALGASGSGKSTLLHLLGGLDSPDRRPKPGDGPPGGDRPIPRVRNTVAFEGQAIGALSARDLDQYRLTRVGFVFQFYHLLPELTALENALLPAMALHGRFGFAARRRALRDRASSLLSSIGLGSRLRHRPAELSGGERQRVAIARALMNEPRVLLADEPTGNLDRASGESILDAIASIRSGRTRTIVMVTHDERIAGRADRVVRLQDGVVVGA